MGYGHKYPVVGRLGFKLNCLVTSSYSYLLTYLHSYSRVHTKLVLESRDYSTVTNILANINTSILEIYTIILV